MTVPGGVTATDLNFKLAQNLTITINFEILYTQEKFSNLLVL